jgi:hypothetical protein
MNSIKYRDGYSYQIAEDYTLSGLSFPLHKTNRIFFSPFLEMQSTSITLKAGYASDGPSWPAIDTDTFMRGAFIHDGCYQAIRMGWLPESAREYCDRLLRQICLADGMNPLRAWWVYKGLRVGGGKAADPSSVKVVLSAPRGDRS